ncbi:hypothetical protein BH10PSE7_BH10PSE7_34430 [soil metagenome]
MKTLVNSNSVPSRGIAPVAFASLWHPFLNWSRRRAAHDALSSLSEHHLRDIGVTRGDIDTVIDRELGAFRSR